MIEIFLKKTKHILFSLRFSILSIFVTLFVMTTVVIGMIRYIAFSDELTYTSFSLMQHISDVVLHEVDIGLTPVEQAGHFSARLIESGVLKNDLQQLLPYTFYIVRMTRLVPGAYWGDEQGNFIYTGREPDGTILSDIIFRHGDTIAHTRIHRDLNGNIIKRESVARNNFDPRQRPWYLKAKQQHKTIWTNIYLFYPDQTMGISTASPVYNKDGSLKGVFGLDVSLEYLTRFITGQKVSEHGYAFIITNKEDLVAYPLRPPFTNVPSSPHTLINVHRISLPLIDKAIDFYKKTHRTQFNILYKGDTYLVTFQPIPRFAEQGWLVGVIAPKNDFVSFLLEVNLLTYLISFIALIISIWIVSHLITRVVKPIKVLVHETEKIRRFELEDTLNLPSRIKEVVDLRNAIMSMKRGLKQFQRYVPRLLVRQLIESGEDIRVGGVRKQLVVLFSDIENFTTVAERMDPNELMDQMCEYFESITQIIISQKGTVDKYIGDSIMAFWGAPLQEDDPSDRAAKTALLCEEKIKELNAKWEKEGKPAFPTRIGIHKGEAIVGNLGSSERLNYTAVGDTINISSRLENINKVYRTKIIVSDAVYQDIKDRFILRLLDCVVVKGRTTNISIYELLSDDISRVPFDLNAYQEEFAKGFAAYKKDQWQEAISYFQQCLIIYPYDTIAPLFIKRCKKNRKKEES